ncbi:MAG: hypothetical protein ACXV6M_09535, partial [Ilumatobacteraceae bacterium]
VRAWYCCSVICRMTLTPSKPRGSHDEPEKGVDVSGDEPLPIERRPAVPPPSVFAREPLAHGLVDLAMG